MTETWGGGLEDMGGEMGYGDMGLLCRVRHLLITPPPLQLRGLGDMGLRWVDL